MTSIFNTTVQTTVLPSYYKYSITSTNLTQTQRKIPKNQMKCYPLDVLKDIDTDGSVTINTKNKKPVSTKAAKDAAKGENPSDDNKEEEIKKLQAQSNTLVLIFSIVFIILGLVLMFALFRTVFPRESASVLPLIAATLPAVLPQPPTLPTTK